MNKKDNQWNVPITKLMIWRSNTWIKNEFNSEKLFLRVCFDQLMIASETKILESVNMNSKIKGIYKDDILILLINFTGQEIRKIKFKIKSEPTLCYRRLGKHFPVSNLNNNKAKHNFEMKYRNIEDVLQHTLDDSELVTSAPLPPNYGDFMKLCLLDPMFPQTVRETEKILQKHNIMLKM